MVIVIVPFMRPHYHNLLYICVHVAVFPYLNSPFAVKYNLRLHEQRFAMDTK